MLFPRGLALSHLNKQPGQGASGTLPVVGCMRGWGTGWGQGRPAGRLPGALGRWLGSPMTLSYLCLLRIGCKGALPRA